MAFKNAVASATGALAASVVDAGAGKTIRQLNFKVNSSAPDCVVALETSPDGTTYTERDRVTGPNWGYAGMHNAFRYARANVVSLGTGTPKCSVTIAYYA